MTHSVVLWCHDSHMLWCHDSHMLWCHAVAIKAFCGIRNVGQKFKDLTHSSHIKVLLTIARASYPGSSPLTNTQERAWAEIAHAKSNKQSGEQQTEWRATSSTQGKYSMVCSSWGTENFNSLCRGPALTFYQHLSTSKSWNFHAKCDLCGDLSPTVLHIPNGCPVALNQLRYTWRHDSVLQKFDAFVRPSSEKIRELLSNLYSWSET